MRLRPTNTCFDDALDFMSSKQVRSQMRDKYRVVHGIVIRQGQRYAHAWIERIDLYMVIQGELFMGERVYRMISRRQFLSELTVECCTRYTYEQAVEMNARHDNFGPWEPEYIALCVPRPAAVGDA